MLGGRGRKRRSVDSRSAPRSTVVQLSVRLEDLAVAVFVVRRRDALHQLVCRTAGLLAQPGILRQRVRLSRRRGDVLERHRLRGRDVLRMRG